MKTLVLICTIITFTLMTTLLSAVIIKAIELYLIVKKKIEGDNKK